MDFTIEKITGPVPVVILATHGDIDASNYLSLVAKAQEIYNGGARDLLLDLGDSSFLSSSGLVALHSIALLMRGRAPHDPSAGWNAIHAAEDDLHSGFQAHVKLLNPQPRVDKVLDGTGFKEFFAIFTDRASALASFSAENAATKTA